MLRPTIVAESLVAVPDPLATVLRPGPIGSGADVARALAGSLRPEEDSTAPPPWLLPHQIPGFRRVLAALRRYGGALLADPVGSGKTYIALAIASVVNRWPAACLVPAPLVVQWRETAKQLGVPAVIGSHQQASRGRLPASERGFVIIDESHHFRNPNTRRYRHVAPWLVGRPTLLLTATPIVNRLTDLAAQLLLGVRADALAPDGVPSLRALLAEGRSSPALGRLVFERTQAGPRPRRRDRTSAATPGEHTAAEQLLAIVDRLHLSRHAPTAALVRGVLCHAAVSSPAAFTAALRRYRTLLLHARDAAAAGRCVDRAAIRRFTGEQPDQIVWWELVAETGPPAELALADLADIDTAIHAANAAGHATDGKLERLRRLLRNHSPTLVFAARRETVRYLRDRLDGRSIAWCTGQRAGVGHTTMPREIVWGWFGGRAMEAALPRVLVTTDVAAEGLDLRRIERVIHYDLPSTPMRLEQREGRAIRLGAAHSTVDVIRFSPPRPLERRLGQLTMLARKARLPATAGLGPQGHACWRWRAELAEHYVTLSDNPSSPSAPPTGGIASVAATTPGILAGYVIDGITSSILWFDHASETWTDDPATVRAHLARAAASITVRQPPSTALRDALRQLAEPLRWRLATAAGRRWTLPEPAPAARELAARLRTHAVVAARRRDGAGLRSLERALHILAGGHTAGEEILIERMGKLPDVGLAAAVARLPGRRPPILGVDVRLTGLVLFGPE